MFSETALSFAVKVEVSTFVFFFTKLYRELRARLTFDHCKPLPGMASFFFCVLASKDVKSAIRFSEATACDKTRILFTVISGLHSNTTIITVE